MAGSYYPLLATAAVTLLAATSAVPVAAAAVADKYSGRMVIMHAPGAGPTAVVSVGSALDKWRQQQRRLVEDEVAPEFGGGLLGAGNGDHRISTEALNNNRAICLAGSQCAAHAGGSNTRPCTFGDYCPHTPTAAGHARAVHA